MAAAISRLFCTLRLQAERADQLGHQGGSRAARSRRPSRRCCRTSPGSYLAKVTPMMVGNMGARARPVTRTASTASQGLRVSDISTMDAAVTSARTAISRVPTAERFLTVEVRNRPTAIARPKKLRPRSPAWRLSELAPPLLELDHVRADPCVHRDLEGDVAKQGKRGRQHRRVAQQAQGLGETGTPSRPAGRLPRAPPRQSKARGRRPSKRKGVTKTEVPDEGVAEPGA